MLNKDLDILHKVTLLGIFKKQSDESLDDVMDILVDTGMYDKAEAQKVFDELRDWGYIAGDGLSFIGVEASKEADEYFKKQG